MGKIIGKENRFDLAFQVVAVAVLIGGVLWLWGSAYLERDSTLAATRLPGRDLNPSA